MDESYFVYDLVLAKTMSCTPFLIIYIFRISWQRGEVFFVFLSYLTIFISSTLFIAINT